MARLFTEDFETNLDLFGTIETGTYSVFERSTDAARFGSYGLNVSASGGTAVPLGIVTMPEDHADVYFGFHVYIGNGASYSQFAQFAFCSPRWSGGAMFSFGTRRASSGSGPMDRWEIGETWSSTNFSVEEWHWVVIHCVTGSESSGYQAWVDGDSIINSFTTDWSARPAFTTVRLGIDGFLSGDGLEDGDFVYFDNFIADDEAYIDEPTGSVPAPSAAMPQYIYGA